MSSVRNAVARRPHRERAQPLERRRLGLLEKHKDYSKRAKDYNEKKEKLRSLRQKATERNEDEFYFGMMSRRGPGSRIQDGRRWKGTVEGDRGNKAMDVETVRLLKTQDLGYVRTMRQVTAKEVRKLEEQLVMTRGFDHLDDNEEEEDDDFDDSDDDHLPMPVKPKPPRKIVFVDDEDQQDEAVEDIMDEDEDQDNEAEDGKDSAEKSAQELARTKSVKRLQRQLDQARTRLKALNKAEMELDVQRAKMAKTQTSGGSTRKGKKLISRRRKR